MEHLTNQPKNQPKNRDELVVNWYEKELNKDRKELEVSKHQYINLLKTVDKTKIFESKEKPKLTLWQKIMKVIMRY